MLHMRSAVFKVTAARVLGEQKACINGATSKKRKEMSDSEPPNKWAGKKKTVAS